MKCQSIFWEKIRKLSSICHLLNYSKMIKVKITQNCASYMCLACKFNIIVYMCDNYAINLLYLSNGFTLNIGAP